MADSYIDLFESVIYGRLAVEEMRARVMPLHRDWAGAIERAILLQEEANTAIEATIAQIKSFTLDPSDAATVADTIVRFGAWIDSLKGRPLDPYVFFNGAPPSHVGRRRVAKLAGHLELMIAKLTPYAEGEESKRIDGAASRLAELREAHAIAVRNRDAQRAALESRKVLSPEAEKTRLKWLSTYTANKRLIEGILRHHELETFMPLIFDDLAEVQRTRRPEASDPLVDGPDDTEGPPPSE